MDCCYNDYTVIYSQPCIEHFEKLVSEISHTFGLVETMNDMFYYGVFCKPQNYANFYFDVSENYGFEIPALIMSCETNESERIDYVKKIISKISHKEIKKPEWMKYIEMTVNSNEFGQSPSTFLYIEPKEEKYRKLGERLIDFLYSPNLTITMLKSDMV